MGRGHQTPATDKESAVDVPSLVRVICAALIRTTSPPFIHAWNESYLANT